MSKRSIYSCLMMLTMVFKGFAQAELPSEAFGTMPRPLATLINTDNMSPQTVMSLAWAAYERGDLGSALQYAWRVRHITYDVSEPNYLMGLVFAQEGLFDLAERAFKDALLRAHSPQAHADYAIALADLYYDMQEYEAMSQQLEDVIFGRPDDDERIAYRTTINQQLKQARLIVEREGLERVIQLYRWQGLHHQHAAERLALYAYAQDAYDGYERAVELFLYSAVQHAGVLIDRMMFYDPSYRFSSLQELFNRAQLYPEMQEYIEREEVYRTLFLLASSLYAYSQSDVSKIIWNALRLQPSQSQWVRRAQQRFYQPSYDLFEGTFHQAVLTLYSS